MMRIEKTLDGEKLLALPSLKLSDANYKEREHLQQMIVTSPDVFFGEIGEQLLVVGQERQPRPEYVGDRIDVLGLDPSGTAVIIELKRDRDKLQLLQSLTYAAMVRTWSRDDFVREHAASKNLSLEAAKDAIDQFLGASVETINARQRVVLVAEHFDFEVLATAEWLSEGYGVEIKCVKIALREDGDRRYMTAETIFPSSPLFDHAWKRRAGGGGTAALAPAVSWEEVCARVAKSEIEALARKLGEELPDKDLNPRIGEAHIRVGDKRTLHVVFRNGFAYVWQSRRFKGDQEFWTESLGPDIDLQEVQGGQALRFYLRTHGQCQALLVAKVKLGGQDYSKPTNGAMVSYVGYNGLGEIEEI